jgi:putative transposase
VVYPAQQSYDDLLQAGGLSWQQTEAVNPNRDETPVVQQREESKKKLAARQTDSVSGAVMVVVEDEWHVVGGEAIGYGVGPAA